MRDVTIKCASERSEKETHQNGDEIPKDFRAKISAS